MKNICKSKFSSLNAIMVDKKNSCYSIFGGRLATLLILKANVIRYYKVLFPKLKKGLLFYKVFK